MARFKRVNDLYYIRTQLPRDRVEKEIGAWCYTKRITIGYAPGVSGTAITSDVSISDEHLSFLIRAVAEMEMEG